MKTAFIALHYQNEVLHSNGKIRLGVAEGSDRREAVIAAAARALAAARKQHLPVIHVQIMFPRGYEGVAQNAPIFRNVAAAGAVEEGSWGAQFYDGLEPISGETIVTHSRVNAFYGTNLDQILSDLGVERLILAGVATNSVVEHTARHAADMGYHVAVAEDACSAAMPHVHQAALDNIALVGEVSSVAALLEDKA